MARKLFKPFAILFGVIAILAIIASRPKSTAKYTVVEIGDTSVRAEIADTWAKQVKGLMFREGMKENEGMLFVFGREDYHGIWMMNMSFPIDIIWIGKNSEVVDILRNAGPCRVSCPTYIPREKAIYVLEVNSRFAERHGIEIGDIIKIAPTGI